MFRLSKTINYVGIRWNFNLLVLSTVDIWITFGYINSND